MRDTEFVRPNGERVRQSMVNNLGQPKGMKSVLSERGKWRSDMPAICKPCKEKVSHDERKTKFAEWMRADHVLLSSQCCARYCLSQEPDFLAQQEWLTETVRRRGHHIIFYPKYHCELNFIERLWGLLKSRARSSCDYSFDSLKKRLPALVEKIPLKFVHKVFRSCFRMMELYKEGLEGPLLEYANKKYKSHRRIPEKVNIDNLQLEYGRQTKTTLSVK